MSKNIVEIKKEMEEKLAELRQKRRGIVARFKKKLEEAKIEQIRKSLQEK